MRILLIVYDNDSPISYFPLSLAYIASACRKAGHEVQIYSQDVYHSPDSLLTKFLDENEFDVVGLSVVGGYYQYHKMIKISEAINNSKKRPFYVLGGHGPSPIPEYFLKMSKADAVVIGEGEETIINLLNAVQEKQDFSTVPGIAFFTKEKKFIQTQEKSLIEDVDSISFPAWDLFPIEHYVLFPGPKKAPGERYMGLIGGRGCKFKCNFCYRLDTGLRIRSPKNIIEEMSILKEKYLISYFDFRDELLMSSQERTVELCEAFLSKNLNVRWCCCGRLNYATPELLKLMKRAGCVFLYYGIEALDDKALRDMNKALTVKQIITGIENTFAAGISPGFNVIFGNIGETAEVLQKDVDFLLKYDDHVQLRTIRPVTPYPGSPLYYYALKKGLLEGPEDFYEKKHVNSDLLSVNFTDMSDEEYYQALYEANKALAENYYNNLRDCAVEKFRKLYFEKDASFRGFRQ